MHEDEREHYDALLEEVKSKTCKDCGKATKVVFNGRCYRCQVKASGFGANDATV